MNNLSERGSKIRFLDDQARQEKPIGRRFLILTRQSFRVTNRQGSGLWHTLLNKFGSIGEYELNRQYDVEILLSRSVKWFALTVGFQVIAHRLPTM